MRKKPGAHGYYLDRFAHSRVGENVVRFELHVAGAQHLRSREIFTRRGGGGGLGRQLQSPMQPLQ